MSKVRVASFAVSIDGFAAGPNQNLRKSARRATASNSWDGSSTPRSGATMHGLPATAKPAPTTRWPPAASTTSARGSSAATCSAPSADHGPTTAGKAGGATSRRTTCRPSCSRITRARPEPMKGGTEFRFVTDGIESALEQAKAAAGGKDVRIGGGAVDGPAIPAEAAARRTASGHSVRCCSAKAKIFSPDSICARSATNAPSTSPANARRT